ncbi:MAG: DUF4402 domain-containing protein [Massilia sp.]
MNTTRQRSVQVLLLASVLAAGLAMAAKAVITTSANLVFGRFVAGTGGSVKVGINSLRTRTGSVILLPSATSAAAFTLDSNGNGNKMAILTLPANGTVALVSGSNQMAVNNFVTNYASGGVLPSLGTTAYVGADLVVAPNQAPGNYAGSFHVTLEFQ